MSTSDDLIAQLQAIADELSDRSITRLRDAIEAGDPEAQADEKRYTRARRAVEKAVAILAERPD